MTSGADELFPRRLPPGWERVLPGVYDDGTGGLHIAIHELLECNGFADTPENRQTTIQALRQMLEARGEPIPLVKD